MSFAEVVLKHTLVYRVEHVFLIHRHTGLLIAHAASQDATSQDPQLVSSMLSAIQDFVRDSVRRTAGARTRCVWASSECGRSRGRLRRWLQ